ncbi:flagellum-specific peptidoglycan hydrolase FlgJ [Lewinella aquimaris]|uniref:Flagellum-specific peptidoglycan hydrolase FlgJ n=1 Tax=Neolewinella aquimaris TaxID=1835722 RepID=A0A840EEC6_9BACT|nr:glucosaminidase domain-containing protein [Neolewinella aquimaris]MBB4079296.1 flagellum-specific peptidoglycan hydrolase FlgJ [Neolewinella aquimaris]
MKVNLPIPRGWRLFIEDLYRRLHRQVTSPWTKVSVLILLAIVVTRKELSFTVSLNGGGLFGVNSASVFSDGGNARDGSAKLVSFRPEKRNWTARELKQLEYINQYQRIAVAQMDAHGIPASITLAQGLLESGTGQSTLATRSNNHFGLKCFSKTCSKGHCSNHSDDHHKDFFRNFATPEESYLAHSQLLRKDRYRKLFTLDRKDYRGWARGLSKAGYATDPNYADKLIRMIESLELHRLDA